MKLVDYYCCLDDYLEIVTNYLENCQKSLYCSSLYIDFDAPLFKQENFREVLTRLKLKGVPLNVKISHLEQFATPPEIEDQIEKIQVEKASIWANIHQIFDSVYHQKYLLIDEKYLFFGGCLFTPFYLNEQEFHYVDSVLFYTLDIEDPVDEAVISYLKGHQLSDPAPQPLLRAPDHLEVIYRLIDQAENLIYIQNQYLISNQYTENQIFTRIKNRLEEKPNLKVIVVINRKNYDHDEYLFKEIFPLLYLYSIYYLTDHIQNDRVKVCYLKDGTREVFIHDKITVIDKQALFTSANYVDRSLDRDIELGILDTENSSQIENRLSRFISYGQYETLLDIYQNIEKTRLEQITTQWSWTFYQLMNIFVYLGGRRLIQ